MAGCFKGISGRGPIWWVRIYFLSKQDRAGNRGINLVSYIKRAGNGQGRELAKKKVQVSIKISRKSGSLIIKNKGLILVLVLA